MNPFFWTNRLWEVGAIDKDIEPCGFAENKSRWRFDRTSQEDLFIFGKAVKNNHTEQQMTTEGVFLFIPFQLPEILEFVDH